MTETDPVNSNRALDSQDQIFPFQERLKTLNEVCIELTKTRSFEELCHKAVEWGHHRLNYDRLSVWFVDESNDEMMGTFGIDAQGVVRDERQFRNKVSANSNIRQMLETGQSCVVSLDAPLYDPLFQVIGRGWHIIAMMMDGKKTIGWISADNLLSQRPLSDADVEILRLYASSIGHLANRNRLEEAAAAFQANLKKLNQLAVEMSRIYSLDELCRHAVESGRSVLGFDRMGIWLLDEDPNYMVGTFGTTEDGQTRDERGIRLSLDQQGEMVVQAMQNRTSQIFEGNAPILNHRGETVGYGGKLFALLWNGDDIIGSLSIDNLLTARPITNYDLEILTLYGSMLGHLIARVRAESALLDERNLLRTIIDTTTDFIFVKDTASRFVLVNKMSWSDTPGVTSELDMIGKTDFDFFPPEKAIGFKADEEAIFRTGQPMLNKEEIGRDSGENQPVQLTTKIPLRDREGNIIGLVGVSRDITDRKQAEVILRESEERLRLATHSAKIGTWDWSVKPDRIVLSDYSCSLLGIPPGDFSGTLDSFMMYIDPLDHDAVREAVRGTFEEHKPLDIEYRIRHPGGNIRWVHSQAEVHSDEVGNPVRLIGIIRDITEQKQAEHARLELAIQQERLDLMAEFIGNLSHDLKTPLSVIQTCLYLLERLDDPVRLRTKIQTIKEQTQLLERLIQDVLTMSRLDHGVEPSFVPINLNLMIHEVVGKLRPTVERKNLSVRLQLDVNLPHVRGSDDNLWRMLTNLIENALNYTPENGTVTVRTFRDYNDVVIEVSDTGIGIDPDDLPRIFDRFYRADPARSFDRGGTGLGLAIVKRIVDMHEGEIQVNSKPGGGSTFRVSMTAFR